MVKSAEARTAKNNAKIQPMVVYLRWKAMIRAGLLETAKIETVKALKQSTIQPIIDSYSLDLRDKLNAWQAFTELYYAHYKIYQSVIKVVSRNIQIENEVATETATLEAIDADTGEPITTIEDLKPFKLRINNLTGTNLFRIQGIATVSDKTFFDAVLMQLAPENSLNITVMQCELCTWFIDIYED